MELLKVIVASDIFWTYVLSGSIGGAAYGYYEFSSHKISHIIEGAIKGTFYGILAIIFVCCMAGLASY